MSIHEHEIIDGFDLSVKNRLGLIIEDSLEWNRENEEMHLDHMKNKIDYYIEYIKNESYKTIYPNDEFTNFLIIFKSDNKLPLKALILTKKLGDNVADDNIEIQVRMATSGSC